MRRPIPLNLKWALTFAFFPVRCEVTNKLIWLTSGYRGVHEYTAFIDMGMGKTTYTIDIWLTKEQFIIKKLRGDI